MKFTFQLSGGVTLAAWTHEREFPELQDAYEYAESLAVSFAGARAVYGVQVFKMNDDGTGVYHGTAKITDPVAIFTFPRGQTAADREG